MKKNMTRTQETTGERRGGDQTNVFVFLVFFSFRFRFSFLSLFFLSFFFLVLSFSFCAFSIHCHPRRVKIWCSSRRNPLNRWETVGREHGKRSVERGVSWLEPWLPEATFSCDDCFGSWDDSNETYQWYETPDEEPVGATFKTAQTCGVTRNRSGMSAI